MDNYFDRKNNKKISQLNYVLGMQHRNQPYDFNKPDDLKEALMKTSAAYLDYLKTYFTLSGELELYDESLEYYSTSSWISLLGLEEEASDEEDIFLEGYRVLSDAAATFGAIVDKQENELRDVLKSVLSATSEMQEGIFSKSFSFNEHNMESKLDKIFEDPSAFDIGYSMEENFKAFMSVAKEILEN